MKVGVYIHRSKGPTPTPVGTRYRLIYAVQAAIYRMKRLFVKPDYTPAMVFPKPKDVLKVLRTGKPLK